VPSLFTYAALRDEIQTDPASLGYTGKANNEIAGLLNRKQAGFSRRTGPVSIWKLLKWSAQNRRYKALEDAASSHADLTVRTVAKVALRLFGSITTLDIDDPDASQMIDVLVGGAVLSAQDRTDFLALGGASPASRAEVLWSDKTFVTDEDVRIALGG
jgi:hypothetical protein